MGVRDLEGERTWMEGIERISSLCNYLYYNQGAFGNGVGEIIICHSCRTNISEI